MTSLVTLVSVMGFLAIGYGLLSFEPMFEDAPVDSGSQRASNLKGSKRPPLKKVREILRLWSKLKDTISCPVLGEDFKESDPAMHSALSSLKSSVTGEPLNWDQGDGESRPSVVNQLERLQRLLTSSRRRHRRRQGLGTSSRPSARRQKRAQLCPLNPNSRRLADMLQALEPLDTEYTYLGRIALYTALYGRDHHNLAQNCSNYFDPFASRHAPVGNLSLCPWELVRNYDERRFPRQMWYARCLCGNCLLPGVTEARVSMYSCMPLYHVVNVLRMVCVNGNSSLLSSTEQVPVGCFCARPTIRPLG